MSPEDIEKTTIENAHAIGELTVIAKQTSKDVDKLINHLDMVPAVRIVSIEKRTGKLEESINDLDAVNRGFVSGTVIRWSIVLAAGAVLSYMTVNEARYETMKEEIHDIDMLGAKVISSQYEVNKNVQNSLNRHEKFLGLEQTVIVPETTKW